MGMVSTLNPMNKEHEPKAHSQLPPGFRFHPTDEELVNYYLTRKILDSNFSGCAIGEADFNKCEPWDLLANAKIGEKEWYFFGLRDRKYPKGHRTNRATEAGYWKTTGKDREVFRSRSSELVGMKKTLVFYKGRARKGEKTNWVMHEYRLESKFSNHHLPENCNLDEWVVCRIFQKSAGGIVNRSAYLDKPASPSLPPLLESPYKTAAANDQETRTSESESVSSAKVDEVSCCSKPTEPMTNSTEHHLQQFECGSRCNYTDSSVQLSEMSRFMKHSSYMHNLHPRIYMNMVSASALFSVSNMMRDQISAQLDQQPGIQQLPDLTPSIRYKTDIPLPSNFSNIGVSTHAYFSALHFSKALVGQSAGSPMQPYSSSSVHDKELSNNNTVEANNSVNSFQMANFCQNLLAQPVVGNIAEGDLRTTDMNNEMTSVVCNRMDQPLDPLDYSAARSWDFDSLWNIEDHLF